MPGRVQSSVSLRQWGLHDQIEQWFAMMPCVWPTKPFIRQNLRVGPAFVFVCLIIALQRRTGSLLPCRQHRFHDV
jgi:hypothetical protein